MTELKAIRKRRSAGHRWSETQLLELVELVVNDSKDNPEMFEKPTAQKYYTKIAESSCHLTAIDWECMKSKMRYCKAGYIAAVTWQAQTGAGLMAKGEEQTVTEYIKKRCPHWDMLQQLFGKKKNINPPVTLDTNEVPSIVDVDDAAEKWALEVHDVEAVETQSGTSMPSRSNSGNSGLVLATFSDSSSSDSSSSVSVLAATQQKKIELETEKFQWMKEKESLAMKLETEKFQWMKEKESMQMEIRKIELQHELEMKKLEMEKEERLTLAKIKIDAEVAERLQKVELELQIKRNL